MALDSEQRVLDWLRERLRRLGYDRIGDDAAILPRGGPWAVTTDRQDAGVHFPLDLDPALVARRLLAVNLSDLAAMGAEPMYAFFTLSGSPRLDFRRLFVALLRTCRRYGIELAGGDLGRGDRLRTSLTIIGRRPPGGRWLRRQAGRVGDRLWLGGEVGVSALGRVLLEAGAKLVGSRVELPTRLAVPPRCLGLARRAVRRHLIPQPQLELGWWLGKRTRAAAIDLSDGLAIDLHRLCRESDVGAEISIEQLRIDQRFCDLSRHLGADPQELALGGGEDYVLLFAMSPRVRPPREPGCRPVGRLLEGRRLRLVEGGSSRPLPESGWDHFRR